MQFVLSRILILELINRDEVLEGLRLRNDPRGRVLEIGDGRFLAQLCFDSIVPGSGPAVVARDDLAVLAVKRES